MQKLMPTLLYLVLSFSPAALAQSTVPSPVTAIPANADSLNRELARFFGTNLAFTDCRARMADMETMLGTMGYGSRSTRTWSDGRVYAGWYDAVHDMTVMAVAAPSDDGHGYQLDAYTLEGRGR